MFRQIASLVFGIENIYIRLTRGGPSLGLTRAWCTIKRAPRLRWTFVRGFTFVQVVETQIECSGLRCNKQATNLITKLLLQFAFCYNLSLIIDKQIKSHESRWLRVNSVYRFFGLVLFCGFVFIAVGKVLSLLMSRKLAGYTSRGFLRNSKDFSESQSFTSYESCVRLIEMFSCCRVGSEDGKWVSKVNSIHISSKSVQIERNRWAPLSVYWLFTFSFLR